jgi:hypothetical protein
MPMGDDVTMQAVDPTVITPGSDFGPRYRVESLLGQGGMGRVYKAYDKELDRTVAIKVVRDGAIGQSDALKRFKQELVLASKISHKNILRIHDMGDVGGMRFISMAYVDGKDLQHIIRDNPKMPLDRILNFAKQIADALAAAHAEGVVHRDLKRSDLRLRLWTGEILRRGRDRDDADGRVPGYAAVYVAGAGGREAGRQSSGPLRVWTDLVRDGGRRCAVHRRIHAEGDVPTDSGKAEES